MTTSWSEAFKTPGLWLGLLLHGVAPAAAVITMGAPALWLLSTVLFVSGMVAWAPGVRSVPVRVIACAASGLWMLLSVMLTAAYFSQGQGFDEAFFYHFNGPAIATGFEIYPVQSFGSSLLLILAALWPLMLKTARAPAGLAVLLVAVLIATPVHSLIDYRAGLQDAAVPGTALESEAREVEQARLAAPGTHKNIVLIYAEGVEQGYFDEELFGGLLPRLSELNEQGTRFTNLRQVRGTGWTIGGMVASQCGFPLMTTSDRSNNSTMASTDRPFDESRCLGDILKDKGYRNVFYGGADHRFAGKGNFLRTHGYDEVYGVEELAPELGEGAPLNQWGLYDEQLLAIALERIQALEADSSTPWMVTALTVDTHFPTGHPSPGCAPFEATGDEISQAMYCTDQVISEFVRQVQAITDPDTTVIALFSDHLSFRNSLAEKLDTLEERRLWFTILDGDLGDGEVAVPGTHFDVGPTLLSVAGVEAAGEIESGISLVNPLPEKRPGWSEVAAAAPRLLSDSPSALETGVLVNATDLTMTFDDLVVVPHMRGYPFEEGIFMALLDDQGRVIDTVFESDSDELLQKHTDRFVVGVSVVRDAQQAVLFVGTISEDPSLMNQALLQQNMFIAPEQFAEWLNQGARQRGNN